MRDLNLDFLLTIKFCFYLNLLLIKHIICMSAIALDLLKSGPPHSNTNGPNSIPSFLSGSSSYGYDYDNNNVPNEG